MGLLQISVSPKDAEVHYFTVKMSICFFLTAMAFAPVVLFKLFNDTIGLYLLWTTNILIPLEVYIIFRDISLLTIRNRDSIKTNVTLATPLIQTIPSAGLNSTPSAPTVTGIPIINKDKHSIGMAPHAPRPLWLPNSGVGQVNVKPKCWSISLENWVNFVNECMITATWTCLAMAKGEGNVNMYDINTHFIKPWTMGTGCSVACLMDDHQGPVDLMVSHAWSGSVLESLASIKTIMSMYFLPKETRIFFDTLCMYQAEDGAVGGLSIPEQLKMKPFTTIIHQRPHHGMFVIHTTISEVYDRLWCVHEVDEAIEAGITMYGVFDPTSWTTESLKNIVTSFSTISAECQGESDRVMLTDSIMYRGDFNRVDSMVREVRRQSIKDFEAVDMFEQLFSVSISSNEIHNRHMSV